MNTLPSRGNAHLCPVGEDLAVAAVCDQLLRKLRDSVVQVVHDHQDDGDCLTGLPRVQLQRVRPARDERGRSLGDTPGTAAAGTPCTRRERTVTGGHPGYSCSGYTLHETGEDGHWGAPRVQLQRVRPARDGRGRSLGDTPGTAAAGTPCTRRERTVTGGHPGYSCSGYALHETREDGHWETPRVQLQRVRPARDGRGRSLGDTPGTAAAGTPCTRRERTVTGGHPGYSCSGYTLHETREDGHWGTPRVQLQRVHPARDERGRSLEDTPGTAAAGTPCTRRERTVTGGHPGHSCSGYALHETGEDGHWRTPRVQLQRVHPARDERGRSLGDTMPECAYVARQGQPSE